MSLHQLNTLDLVLESDAEIGELYPRFQGILSDIRNIQNTWSALDYHREIWRWCGLYTEDYGKWCTHTVHTVYTWCTWSAWRPVWAGLRAARPLARPDHPPLPSPAAAAFSSPSMHSSSSECHCRSTAWNADTHPVIHPLSGLPWLWKYNYSLFLYQNIKYLHMLRNILICVNYGHLLNIKYTYNIYVIYIIRYKYVIYILHISYPIQVPLCSNGFNKICIHFLGRIENRGCNFNEIIIWKFKDFFIQSHT